MATTIGTAYVQILPSTKDISANLEDALGGASESAGKKSGSKFGQGVKSAAKAIGKGAVAAVGAASVAAVSLGKAVVSSYSEFEQLEGGVEAIFGDSADAIKKYADDAYKTAGLSASGYMETVTGFSSSLIQGLGGDTEAAARIAHSAVVDMSDNANRFGTDMTSIQNAYQGFAKNNYTMLDNLKLGYGGTQSEMIRLINDSGILNKKIESMDGITFDQVIEAIHAVQENIGVAGTTAAEAEGTISGSIGMMTSSWDNFLVALGDPNGNVTSAVQNLVGSFGTVVSNITPILSNIVAALPAVFQQIIPAIGTLIPQIVTAFSTLVSSLLQTISAQLSNGELIGAIIGAVLSIADVIIQNLPVFVGAALQIIQALIDGLTQAMPTLIPAAISAVLMIVQAIIENLPAIINSAVAMVDTIVETIMNVGIPMILEAAPEIVTSLVNGIIENLPALVQAGIMIIPQLIVGILQNLPQLLASIGMMVVSMISAIVNADWSGTGSGILEKFTAGFDRMKQNVVNAVKNVVQSIKQWFLGLPAEAQGWARDMINGFINGIKALIGKVRSAAQSVAGAVKSILHFSRPDEGPLRDYDKWMPDMMRGLAKGITDNKRLVEEAASDAAFGISSNLSIGASRSASGSTTNYGGVTLNVYGRDGQSAAEIADEVMARLNNATNRRLSAFA